METIRSECGGDSQWVFGLFSSVDRYTTALTRISMTINCGRLECIRLGVEIGRSGEDQPKEKLFPLAQFIGAINTSLVGWRAARGSCDNLAQIKTIIKCLFETCTPEE